MTRQNNPPGSRSGSSLVPQPRGRDLVSTRSASQLISRVTSDALVTLNTLAPTQTGKVWRIGSHEFCEEDYQQLVRWLCDIRAEEGPRTLEDLVGHLQRGFEKASRLHKLRSSWIVDRRIRVACLASLGMKELDLSFVTALTVLWCGENQLAKLDLSGVPGLTELNCWKNQLTELDLSNVPGLTSLYCGGNPWNAMGAPHRRFRDLKDPTRRQLRPLLAAPGSWCMWTGMRRPSAL